MATIFNFMKCEVCGTEFSSVLERKSVVDKEGFTHTYCHGCYSTSRPGNGGSVGPAGPSGIKTL
ncbi:Uncharacterised protein [Candidatus Burarchaeum australiense]|nr:Uncharacterised protein [Candidatus Burarchaeum australiense]